GNKRRIAQSTQRGKRPRHDPAPDILVPQEEPRGGGSGSNTGALSGPSSSRPGSS
ncbi:6691_t:CDS:2, partial [Ambispora leptoticha]